MNAEKIKDFRKSAKMTQTQLANSLGRTRDCVAKYESGKYPIPERVDIIMEDLTKMRVL